MLPYLLILFFVLFWITLEQKAINRKSFWLPLVTLVLFFSVRSNQVGTDTQVYTYNFDNSLDVKYFDFKENVELGYQLLEYSILQFTDNYFWLFFISGLVVVYLYLKVIRKYSVNYLLSVFLFITLGIYTFFFNGLRQGIAMAIFTFALPYLLERKIILYILVCLFASLFHITALFMIPFYFLVNLRIKPIYKILITFLGSLLLSRLLVTYIASTNDRYESYTEVSESSGGILILLFYFLILLFIYFIANIYKVRDEQFKKLFTFYGVGLVFVIPLALLGTNPSGPQRLLYYFTWTLVLILPIIFNKINNTYVTSIAITFFIIYFILTTTRFSDLTPYIINPIFKAF